MMKFAPENIKGRGLLAIKIPVAIFLVIAWNVLFFFSELQSEEKGSNSKMFEILAFGLMAGFALLTLLSSRFREFVLAPKRRKYYRPDEFINMAIIAAIFLIYTTVWR